MGRYNNSTHLFVQFSYAILTRLSSRVACETTLKIRVCFLGYRIPEFRTGCMWHLQWLLEFNLHYCARTHEFSHLFVTESLHESLDRRKYMMANETITLSIVIDFWPIKNEYSLTHYTFYKLRRWPGQQLYKVHASRWLQ